MSTRPFAAMPGWQRVGQEPVEEVPEVPPVPPEAPTTEQLLGSIIGHLDGMHRVLNLILRELREQVQVGFAYPLTIVTTGLVPVEALFDPPLFALSLTNDGPGTIQYRIPNNTAAFWIDLFPTEVITFNNIKGVITSVGFRAQGANGTIRAVGLY